MPGFLSFTLSQSLLKLMSIELVIPSNHLIFCCPLLLLSSIFPSNRVFSSESSLHIWPNYWSFSFTISPSKEYSGLISFRMDWFDLLAVQGTLKSLLQHHSSKASILLFAAFSMVKLSHLYMTTEALQLCLTLCNPMDCQAPLSMGFSRQEYWNGLPFPPPEHLPNPGIDTDPMADLSLITWLIMN